MSRTPKPRTIKPAETVDQKVARQMIALANGKAGYSLSDALMDQLETEMLPGQEVEIPKERRYKAFAGKRYKLVDKWEGKSKVNTGMNVRRYTFEEIP